MAEVSVVIEAFRASCLADTLLAALHSSIVLLIFEENVDGEESFPLDCKPGLVGIQFSIGPKEDVVVLQPLHLEISPMAVLASGKVGNIALAELQVDTVTQSNHLDGKRMVGRLLKHFLSEQILSNNPAVLGQVEPVLTEQRDEAQK